MNTFIRSAIFAAAVLAGLSAANARYGRLEDNGRTPNQYNLDSRNDVWEFWENQRETGSGGGR
jgi:hypothetical protein